MTPLLGETHHYVQGNSSEESFFSIHITVLNGWVLNL